MSASAVIYNIQRYSLHDGSGIRTVVFFKGCPLRCRWCCNPESHNPNPELSYIRSKCIGYDVCGMCEKACPSAAISFDGDGCAKIDHVACTQCLRCTDECPPKALRSQGWAEDVSAILDTVEQDAVFYRKDAGGLTLSGGEPLFQPEALLALLNEAKKRKIGAAIETCGFADYEILKSAAQLLDVVIYDIKHMDGEYHRKFTGQTNALILKNFMQLCEDFPRLPKIVRTPVIPGFNDTPGTIAEIEAFINGKSNIRFEALPYHRFGVSKYEWLGRDYELGRMCLNTETINWLNSLNKSGV